MVEHLDNSYVADVDIETGTLGVVVPDSENPEQAAPQQQTGSKEERAIAWANQQVGSNAYPSMRGRFVANAYGKPQLGVASAQTLRDQLSRAGQIHMDMNFPKGVDGG